MWSPVTTALVLIPVLFGISYAASIQSPNAKASVRADAPAPTEVQAFLIFNPATTADGGTYDLPEGWEFLPQELVYNPNDGRVIALIKRKITVTPEPTPAP